MLIILFSIVIPLVLINIALCALYRFRKNRLNTVALLQKSRKNSSRNVKGNFEKMKNRNQHLDEDKIENQGKTIPQIMPSDVDQIPQDDLGIMNKLMRVPTDAQVAEILKNKTGKEKRRLLAEVDKAH